MIAKVIPAKAGSRTFGQLVNYVTADNRLGRPPGREFEDLVRYVGRENTVDPATGEVIAKAVAIETQGVASLRTAALEMEAVAAHCRRLRAPADYHFVVSWQDGEHPTPDQAFAAGRHALAAVGMDAHQYVMAVHADTANVHLHVAVNRVHPESYRAVSPFRDYLKLDRAMREVELQQSWAHSPGPMVATEHGVVMTFKDQTRGRGINSPARVSSKARDLAAWSGERPFTESVQDAAPALQATLRAEGADLESVEKTLSAFGLALRLKGSGLVVVKSEDPSLVAKASHIARFMSRNNLEQRFGPLADRLLAFKPAVREASRTAERLGSSHAVGPERRVDGPGERAEGRERLYAAYQAARQRADAGQLLWDQQRASERRRFEHITARKLAYRRELAVTGVYGQISISLAAFRAAQERTDLREEIARERAALKRKVVLEKRQAWREFVTEQAMAGDEAAISLLRGLRYRDRWRALEDERVCSISGVGDQEPRVVRDLRGLTPRVERNGDVSYRWVADAKEAFRDQGQRIAFTDTSDESVRAGLELARAKWGNTVQLNGSDEFKERALRLAVEQGMRIANVELQDLQRQVIAEFQPAPKPTHSEIVRILDRDPYGFGSDKLLVERYDRETKEWVLEDFPPVAGDVELGECHVVRVFADGRHDVDDERTQKLRAELRERELPSERVPTRERDVGRGRSL